MYFRKAFGLALVLAFLLSSCSSSSTEESSTAPVNTCESASDEDLKNINEGMISAKYRVESGFRSPFPPDDGLRYIVAPPQKYVIAATIQGTEGDSVIGVWGIQIGVNFSPVSIFALNKQTQKYSVDLQSNFYYDKSGNLRRDRGEEFTAAAEAKTDLLQLSVDTNLLSCFQK
jgi:hypothetical protein